LKLLFPVVLAELSTGEADFAGNPGAMPPSGDGIVPFEVVGMAKSGKSSTKVSGLANRAKLTNRSSRMSTAAIVESSFASEIAV